MELKEQLEALETNIKADNKELIEKAIEGLAVDQKLKDSSDEVKQLVNNLIEQAEEKLQKNFNEYSAKLNEKQFTQNQDRAGYHKSMRDLISENIKNIGQVEKSGIVSFTGEETKAVANMLTTGDHVTGDYIRDYNRNVITLPGDRINVADLIPSISIDGGTYTYIRETGGEGAVATQTEGSDKALVDADFSHIDLNTDFIAGRTVYSKKMRNNLQYLQSYLPEALRRKYFLTENSQFNSTIAAAATVSTNFIASFDNISELIMADVESLDVAKYSANGIVMNISDWYAILKTEKSTGAGYGLPFGFTYDTASNTLRCLGIPVFKADWVAATKYYVGDWNMIERVITEGLSLEFSYDERFSKNEIVARVEAQVGLAVKQPASIIIGDTDATA
ncbi:phage major capsid protein [Flagellimonas sp. SN16]|uniref:phage major capsid protein n=1 Tax=Flagellimonas sp. SN16 TaxID=3415142 RepID=UPI003C5EF447